MLPLPPASPRGDCQADAGPALALLEPEKNGGSMPHAEDIRIDVAATGVSAGVGVDGFSVGVQVVSGGLGSRRGLCCRGDEDGDSKTVSRCTSCALRRTARERPATRLIKEAPAIHRVLRRVEVAP